MLWGLICFVHPSQPLEEENNFEIWGARGIKLSRVWIICPSTVCTFSMYCLNATLKGLAFCGNAMCVKTTKKCSWDWWHLNLKSDMLLMSGFLPRPYLIRWCSPIAQALDGWCDIEGVIQSFSNIIGQTDESALNWPRLCKLWETLVRVCFSRMKIRWLMKLTPEKSCVGCEVGLEPLKLWAHGVWTFWIAYSVRPGGNASRMGKMSTKLEFISLWIVINCHINQY